MPFEEFPGFPIRLVFVSVNDVLLQACRPVERTFAMRTLERQRDVPSRGIRRLYVCATRHRDSSLDRQLLATACSLLQLQGLTFIMIFHHVRIRF